MIRTWIKKKICS